MGGHQSSPNNVRMSEKKENIEYFWCEWIFYIFLCIYIFTIAYFK